MILQEVNFSDGSRIFYKFKNNVPRRVIQYSFGDCIDNAGKYYYLHVLEDYRKIGERTYNDLKAIYDLTTDKYSHETCKRISNLFSSQIYGQYANIFFTAIYLAMVDLEQSKLRPMWPGKKLVLESCRLVLLENVSYKDAAVYHYEIQNDEETDDDKALGWSDRELSDSYDAAYEGHSRLELGLEG